MIGWLVEFLLHDGTRLFSQHLLSFSLGSSGKIFGLMVSKQLSK